MSAINFIENEETEKLEPKVLACLYMIQLPDNKAPNNADVSQFRKNMNIYLTKKQMKLTS